MIHAEISRCSDIGLANTTMVLDIRLGYLILINHHIICISLFGSKKDSHPYFNTNIWCNPVNRKLLSNNKMKETRVLSPMTVSGSDIN
jgi:hypothetical protein